MLAEWALSRAQAISSQGHPAAGRNGSAHVSSSERCVATEAQPQGQAPRGRRDSRASSSSRTQAGGVGLPQQATAGDMQQGRTLPLPASQSYMAGQQHQQHWYPPEAQQQQHYQQQQHHEHQSQQVPPPLPPPQQQQQHAQSNRQRSAQKWQPQRPQQMSPQQMPQQVQQQTSSTGADAVRRANNRRPRTLRQGLQASAPEFCPSLFGAAPEAAQPSQPQPCVICCETAEVMSELQICLLGGSGGTYASAMVSIRYDIPESEPRFGVGN